MGPEEEYIADEHPLKCIGTDVVQLELIRESFTVYKLVYLCRVYADPKSEEETRKAAVHRPYIPASLLRTVVLRPAVMALSLYRQEPMWKRLDVDLKRSITASRGVLISDTC